ncbi:MAG TPA: hypothetical protein VHE78_11265 [Gemmatimonadaceae bacterium]|nr:hypothetical protein [Gemmatimonadaceae bacterium]
MPEFSDFTNHPVPPHEWTQLVERFALRKLKMRCDLLRSTGAARLATEILADPAAFRARMAIVDA